MYPWTRRYGFGYTIFLLSGHPKERANFWPTHDAKCPHCHSQPQRPAADPTIIDKSSRTEAVTVVKENALEPLLTSGPKMRIMRKDLGERFEQADLVRGEGADVVADRDEPADRPFLVP